MDNTKPPPPTAISPKPKPKPAKKLKKTTSQKKQKTPQPTTLSPISKKDKADPKQKLYELYENYNNKRADNEIKMAEQKQLEVLRDMLVKGFAVKNLQSLHKTLLPDKKNATVKINERGDGLKIPLSEKNASVPKVKGATVKKNKPLKKSSLKKN